MDSSLYMAKAGHILQSIKGRALSIEQKREMAIELAGLMLQEARRTQAHSERKRQRQLARMMNDAAGKAFTTCMTDQCFRSERPRRVADQLVYLIEKFGVPKFLSPFKRFQLLLFKWLGKPLAHIMVPMVKKMVRREAAGVILPGEPDALLRHMQKRHQEGVRVNLNHIGEAILGEEEAARRLQTYLNDLANPAVECVSVKASTIFSQINLLGWENTLQVLGARLKRLYHAAKENVFIRPDGKKVPKFVYLDMEEYRDLYLTVELFCLVLDDPEFYRYTAGIVLQSYLPDSFLIQQSLTTWAMKRVANGGAPIKIRLVKGANLAMEKVEASLRLWPQAPYLSKSETDANYKRMVMYGCNPENARAASLGIASHNLFDIAYAMVLRVEKGVERYVGFEMLEGMADHMRRIVQKLSGDMLLYCPAAVQNEFQSAAAYLMRRLDENTAPDNFLRHAFDLLPGTTEWQTQADMFSMACHSVSGTSYRPRRQQNRFESPVRQSYDQPFANEPDTDWSLLPNIKWGATILRNWTNKAIDPIPLVLGGRRIIEDVEKGAGIDPSCPHSERYHYALAGEEQMEIALKTATEAFVKWSQRPLRERLLLIEEVAHTLRCRRGDLIGAMVFDAAKTVIEADHEVSEAIDFAAYYWRSVEDMHFIEDVRWHAKGPVLVAPPWNFPCSIPAGGIIAALAAGNSVIFKPAPEAVLVGWQLANIFWEAGIDKEVLQFFCCHDDPIGSQLIQDSRIASVVLTGSTTTAKDFLRMRPGIDLIAETGGKNSMIITSMADRDLAIRDLVQSAFGYAGQKCSACSLAILEKEVYDDPNFRRQLRDAAASMHVGQPWDLSTRVNPLIRPPNPQLLRGLTTLDEGEEWLLQPRRDEKNSHLWSPGIKLGVREGSFMHQTELFGPVLGVMRADDLQHALRLANGTPYGLTAGIHTLDEREWKVWLDTIVAGNCYINRSITGAVVRRQPFGGCKESSFGSGAKAGGPDYILQFMRATTKGLPREREPIDLRLGELNLYVQRQHMKREEVDLWIASIGSYAFYWNRYFSRPHDPSSVLGQENLLCYKPQNQQVLRIQPDDSPLDILRAIAAALTCKSALEVSAASFPSVLTNFPELPSIRLVQETDAQLIKRISTRTVKRVRFLSEPNTEFQKAMAEAACQHTVAPVMANGRLELLNYLRSVSISHDYHRYGFLGFR